ncbi:reverse transcriptase domain-containing protein, partial [Tanacetum coccineum]
MPRECLKIIESKSKVRQSRSKAIVSKVSTGSSTPAVSSDVAELKDMVRALILDKKNQTPAPSLFFPNTPQLGIVTRALELVDRSITELIGIAKDVRLMVGKFQFPADFVVVDFELDPRVPLILGRIFLKTSRELIDVYEGEITLCVGKEAITFNLDQTSRYTPNYNHMTANRIDVIELSSEEYSQEVLEANAFIAINDEPISWEIDATYYDPEGDILILKALLNSEPLPPLPNHKDYSPKIREELKVVEAKSSFDEPPEVELKDLPPHLEYAFLEGDHKLPVIIAKDLKDEEKAALIKVLKSHKRAIAWKLSDISHFASECRKPKENKAYVGGAWSDSKDGDKQLNDATCLMEIDSQE